MIIKRFLVSMISESLEVLFVKVLKFHFRAIEIRYPFVVLL